MNNKYLSFAKNLSQDAGRMIMQSIFPDEVPAGQKMVSAINYSLTALGTQVEDYMINRINRKFPNHSIYQEGKGETRRHQGFEWAVAPIDGIVNYSIGVPLYGTSIALAYQGEPIAAVISLPTLGEMFWASKGEGAFLDGKQLKVRNNHLSKTFLSIGNFSEDNDKENRIMYEMFKNRMLTEAKKVRIVGAASATLAYIAAGRTDAAVFYSPRYCDIAAGELLITEAGGIKQETDGYMIFGNKKSAGELLDRLSAQKTNVAG